MSPLSILALASALVACAQGSLVREVSVPQGSSAPYGLAPLGLGKVRSDGAGARGGAHNIDPQIVGGRDAHTNEFPHQVSMQVTIPGYAAQHLCGGTLIATNWVLTAAHCVYGVPNYASRVEVVVGITDLTKRPAGSQRIQVLSMLVHGSYDTNKNNGVGPYDIALLKLASPARLSASVKLASLPAAGSYPTGNAILSGWGSTSSNGDRPVYPNKLQTATFPLVAFSTCYNYVSRSSPREPNPLDQRSNLCVGPLDRTGLSSCSGDSGGPLIQTGSGNNAVVIGVVSWGLKNCASVPYPSVFTRVSAFNDWIALVQRQY